MIIFLLISLLRYCQATEYGNLNESRCYEIRYCTNKFEYYLEDHKDAASVLRNQEEEIGVSGRWYGFKPNRYNLQLFFQNTTDFNGSVEIEGVIERKTNTLAVNIDREYLKCGFFIPYISCCSSSQRPNICFGNLTYYSTLKYMMFRLTDSLLPGERCTIKYQKFWSSVKRDTGDRPAVGLRISEESGSTAIITDFRKRYARTVFPCIDHPAAKAKFLLSIRYPIGFRAISNSHLTEPATTTEQDGYSFSTFSATPALSTYSFGFALLKGYELLPESAEAPSLYIYAPKHSINEFSWIPKVFYEEIKSIGEVTLPSYLMSFVVVDSIPTPFVSSYGLTILDRSSIQNHADNVEVKVLLYETILRQYLGAIVTVANWNKVFLLDGLVQYFKFNLKEFLLKRYGKQLISQPLEEICISCGRRLIESVNESTIDTNGCNEYSRIFFHSLSNIFGRRVMKDFLTKLLANYSFRTTTVSVWDEELAKVAYPGTSLNGYIAHHFQQSEPSVLNVYLNKQDSYVDIRVRKSAATTFPIPLKIYLSTDISRIYLVLNSPVHIALSKDDNGALVDPDGDTCITKVYNDVAYEVLLKPRKYHPNAHLSERRLRGLLDNLCFAFMNNLLDYDENNPSWTWLVVFDYAYDLNANCRCCFVRRNSTDCSQDELARCSKRWLS